MTRQATPAPRGGAINPSTLLSLPMGKPACTSSTRGQMPQSWRTPGSGCCATNTCRSATNPLARSRDPSPPRLKVCVCACVCACVCMCVCAHLCACVCARARASQRARTGVSNARVLGSCSQTVALSLPSPHPSQPPPPSQPRPSCTRAHPPRPLLPDTLRAPSATRRYVKRAQY